jgi:hypothetical protein
VSPASLPQGATLARLNASFRRTLRAEDKSERTVKSYTEAVGLLADFLAPRGHPLTVNAVKRADIRDFIADQLERWKPAWDNSAIPPTVCAFSVATGGHLAAQFLGESLLLGSLGGGTGVALGAQAT